MDTTHVYIHTDTHIRAYRHNNAHTCTYTHRRTMGTHAHVHVYTWTKHTDITHVYIYTGTQTPDSTHIVHTHTRTHRQNRWAQHAFTQIHTSRRTQTHANAHTHITHIHTHTLWQKGRKLRLMETVSCPWLEKQVWPSSLTQVGHHVTPAPGLGCGTHPVSLGHQGPRSCALQFCFGEMVERGSEPWTAPRALEPDPQSPAGHWERRPWGWVGRADPRRPQNSSTEQVPRPLVARPWGTQVHFTPMASGCEGSAH